MQFPKQNTPCRHWLACQYPYPTVALHPPAMLEVSYPAAGGWAGTKVSGLVVAADPSSATEAGGLTGGLVLT